jgi:Uma2 family endonuclease
MAIQQAAESDQRGMPARPSEPAPRLFTVDEYYKMAEVGILRPDERVQLIEGTIVQMPPGGPDHFSAVDWIGDLFHNRLGSRVRIRVQGPIDLAERAHPEPDLALLRRPAARGRAYRLSHPTVADIFLAVEVADSTLHFDLGEKAQMYARHGLPELWVIDLRGDRLVVHREPTPDGYASVRTLSRGEAISPLAFPDVAFTADEILG